MDMLVRLYDLPDIDDEVQVLKERGNTRPTPLFRASSPTPIGLPALMNGIWLRIGWDAIFPPSG